MKKTGILNADLIHVIATMGHTDRIAIADSGLPIPVDVPRIDVALTAGIPTFLQAVEAVLDELKVELAIVAEETQSQNPRVYEGVKHLLGSVQLDHVPHETLKALLGDVRAVVRTGEQTRYANIILQSGVTF